MSQTLKRTALYQWHVDHGGRMVPFAGWEMPVQYRTGPLEEHHITRRSAGLFDIDHMGQITVSGPDAEAFLNRMVTWNISSMGESEAHYALMCYENGTIVDDVFIYRLPDYWFVVVNASNVDKDYTWMQEQSAGYDIVLNDESDETYMMALQGPKAIELLQNLLDIDLSTVPRFSAIKVDIQINEDSVPTIIGRTGYTGEDGVELFLSDAQAPSVWQAILDMGEAVGIEVYPIGLAARDSLRFEPAFPLYGHEISDEITPLEANLRWACDFESEFIGRDALLRQREEGLPKKLVGFEMVERGVPRQDYPIVTESGVSIGNVVTGLYAPTADKYCGHGFVEPSYAKVGTTIFVSIRNKSKEAVVVKRPFYRPSYRNSTTMD